MASHFLARTRLDHPPEDVFAWHARPGAFARLAPPGRRVEPVSQTGGIGDGARNVFDLRVGPARLRWEAVHDSYEEGRLFRDVQERGPLPRWEHTHRFETDGRGCMLVDDVTYEAPLGPLGAVLAPAANKWFLEPMFRFRHARTRADLDRHARCPATRLRIGVTGASGAIGSALVAYLSTAGHDVFGLARPHDFNLLDGCDAVVHLAGAPVVGPPTPAHFRRVRESRVDGTRRLATALGELPRPPSVLLSASGSAIHRGGAMASLARDWEAATAPAAAAGIRVVNLRFGLVLSPAGLFGAIARCVRVAGGPVPAHEVSSLVWIGLDDTVGAIEALLHGDAEGPVEIVAPEPVGAAELMRDLAEVLHRPRWPVPVPTALRLRGISVAPTQLERLGFEWVTPEPKAALAWELRGELSPRCAPARADAAR